MRIFIRIESRDKDARKRLVKKLELTLAIEGIEIATRGHPNDGQAMIEEVENV